jgi:hypothetical protein
MINALICAMPRRLVLTGSGILLGADVLPRANRDSWETLVRNRFASREHRRLEGRRSQ